MKLVLYLFVLITSAFASINPGDPAPNFTLTNEKGEPVELSALKGKTVILEWTNHDCPFVVKHYNSQNMQKLQKKYTAKGVQWFQVISSAPGKQGHVSAQEAMELNAPDKRNASPTGILFDSNGKVGKAYDAKTTPHMFVINPEGILTYNGAIDSIRSADMDDIPKAQDYVSEALDATLKGEMPKMSKTQPYGCSVKY